MKSHQHLFELINCKKIKSKDPSIEANMSDKIKLKKFEFEYPYLTVWKIEINRAAEFDNIK